MIHGTLTNVRVSDTKKKPSWEISQGTMYSKSVIGLTIASGLM